MAAKYAAPPGKDINAVRRRIGKDIDRMTRGSQAQGDIDYTAEEQKIINEVAAVLRLDKGRVPGATGYIRETITSGENTFKGLFAEKFYVGAGPGGVEALRGKAKESEDPESEGSDIEERPAKRARKGDERAGSQPEQKNLDTVPEREEESSDLSEEPPEPEILTFGTWQQVDWTHLQKGQRLRVTGNHPDISDRIFLVQYDYVPDGEYPAIPPGLLHWMNSPD